MSETFFVTTALPYANGPFHIGHIMEYIQADIWVRFQRLQGHRVHFVCADDTHGAPIMLKAEAEGTTPEELIAGVEKGFYAVSFAGGQVDPTTGDFVFGTSEGYLIEDGKRTRPCRGATLIGHCLQALGRIDAGGRQRLSDDAAFDLRVDDVRVRSRDVERDPPGAGEVGGPLAGPPPAGILPRPPPRPEPGPGGAAPRGRHGRAGRTRHPVAPRGRHRKPGRTRHPPPYAHRSIRRRGVSGGQSS